jgi:hypothetical protein
VAAAFWAAALRWVSVCVAIFGFTFLDFVVLTGNTLYPRRR